MYKLVTLTITFATSGVVHIELSTLHTQKERERKRERERERERNKITNA